MKTAFTTTVAAALFAIASSPCFALMGIAFVSKERAKELGIEIRASPSGPKAASIRLHFKPTGELKLFHHVSLEIQDGETFLLGWTPLKDERTANGNVVASLMANRELLEKVTLRVVVGEPGNYGGYDMRVKDFVDLKNLDDQPPKKPAEGSAKEGKDQPAPPADPLPPGRR
jgi:hypothetical protein